ncbi:odorant receptor 13a-like isoform X2 [Linepithema humile]|uniref:odorant receptor 13a-like isoform X2 n=1 Tax=Linepithema humile TaxID=83485 RepID=UPI00351F234A
MKTMEITWLHYYDIIYKVASLTGMWPFLKSRIKIFRVTLLTLITLTVLVPQIAYQLRCHKSDISCICESMTSYLLSVVILVKIYTFQLNIRAIRSFTQRLFLDWEELKNPEEYEIMKSYATNSRRFSLIYSVYCLSASPIFMSMSLVPFVLDITSPLNESRPTLPPYPGYYFVNIREYFFQILWHAIIAWEILIAGIVAHDCMFVMYVEHICSKFAVVGFRFEHLFYKDKEMEIFKINSYDIYRKKIAFIVHKHREALKFAQLLENIFTIPFAIQMLIATIGISITLLQVTQQNSDVVKSIRYVLYIVGQLIHLFFLSFEGQKLIDHSMQMRDRIYNSCWYEASMRSQKLLVLIMLKSLQPTFLSAGTIYIFSLESFTMVLQTSMSYFTVLASFQ